MWFGTHSTLAKLSGQDLSIALDQQPADKVHDLGVSLDSELSIINLVVRAYQSGSSTSWATCCYSTCPCVNYLAAWILQLSFAGLPELTFQRLQNTAARLIFSTTQPCYTMSYSTSLAGFPYTNGSLYTVCTDVLSYCLKLSSVYYWQSDITQRLSVQPHQSGLRLSKSYDFIVPRVKTKLGELNVLFRSQDHVLISFQYKVYTMLGKSYI